MAPLDIDITEWFQAHRAFLWGLCYRITGSPEDADDLVQETFAQALEHAPDVLEQPRYWLVKVAVNRARNLLRDRKRHGYIGPWLPGPIETSEHEHELPSFEPVVEGERTLEGRYDLMESVSLAFLQALEALSPTQRAVLLLTDVFDYSAAEAAKALDLSVANVRTIHHRAKRSMAAYNKQRAIPTDDRRRATFIALAQFLQLLSDADVAGIERMLASDVRALTDSGGEFTASRRPIVGPARVARFFVKLRESRRRLGHLQIVELNGFPAALIEFEAPMGRRPQRIALAVDVDCNGRITRFWGIANSQKLTTVGFSKGNETTVNA
jgi:RNA polymerase sigma-70 factor (ECF subfamily)